MQTMIAEKRQLHELIINRLHTYRIQCTFAIATDELKNRELCPDMKNNGKNLLEYFDNR